MIQRDFDLEAEILRTTMSGRVTGEDMRRHFEAVRDLGAGRCLELVDARDVQELSLTVSDLSPLALAGREIFSRDQVAPRAVAVSGGFHFGIGCLFAVAAAPWVQIDMFESLEPAETWLFTLRGAWPFPAALRASLPGETPARRLTTPAETPEPRAGKGASGRARLRLLPRLESFSL